MGPPRARNSVAPATSAAPATGASSGGGTGTSSANAGPTGTDVHASVVPWAYVASATATTLPSPISGTGTLSVAEAGPP